MPSFMCGIVGYFGDNASKMLIDVLQRLEYRGYDSAGIAVYDGKINIVKSVGPVKNIIERTLSLKGNIGIGHTRWATHGRVSVENAHPHLSPSGKIAIVHNGIIENYVELKKNFGGTFVSDTDSEVIAHLLDRYNDIKEGIKHAFELLRGDYAVVGIKDGILFGFKKSEPLVVGKGDTFVVISSDPNSISHLAKEIAYLEDNEAFIVNNGVLQFFDSKGNPIKKEFIPVDQRYSIDNIEGDYTFKEIMEQQNLMVSDPTIDFSKFSKVIFTGAGSSFNAALFGSILFLKNGIQSYAILSSEYKTYSNLVNESTLVIGISQSGETADTLRAVKEFKSRGAKVYSIVNVPHSTLDRISNRTFYMNVGPEVSVIATKSFVASLQIISSFVGIDYSLPNIVELFSKLEVLSNHLKDTEHLFVLGTGIGFPIAREGALKLKEISYVHAEAFESGELKHGNIALIEKGTPVIGIVSNPNVLSNLEEVKARGAYVIGISEENNKIFDFWIKGSNPVQWTIPFQILGYQLAKLKKLNPDRPRNLAKSVTVI